MTINLGTPKPTELKPRITVIGVGGAGGNAVNNMIQSNLEGVEFVACNTDAQALSLTAAERRVQLGVATTQGLGSGSKPEIGRASAVEALDEMMDHLQGSHMAFITAGMGGGTGTGAAPVIAQAARDAGILTVGVVTKPFQFEGAHRMAIAEAGIAELQNYVDTLLIIPNQNLFRIANEKTTFADAFKMADDVLHAGVRGVTDLMVMPGLINLDFADVKSVMEEMGKAMMGTGEGNDEKRALVAAEAAISNPLLEDASMTGARGVLINVTGGPDMTLFEVDEAVNRIKDEVDSNANIIFGSTFDERMEGMMRVSIVATGIDIAADAKRPPRLQVVAASSRELGNALPGLSFDETGSAQASDGLKIASSLADSFAIPEAPTSDSGPRPGDYYASAHDSAHESPQTTSQTSAPSGITGYAPVSMGGGSGSMGGGGAATALKIEPDFDDMEAPFIAPPPILPTTTTHQEFLPDPFAEAAVANGGPPSRKGSPSLLERMTGLARGRGKSLMEAKPDPESTPGIAVPEHERFAPEPVQSPPTRMDDRLTEQPDLPPANPTPAERLAARVQAQSREEPEQAPASAPDRSPEMSPDLSPDLSQGSSDLRVSPNDRIAGGDPSDELLEIPAFLRRQAN